MVKLFYYIVVILFLHFILGWVWSVIFTALVAALVFNEHAVSKASLIGFLLNGSGVLATIYFNPEASWNMMLVVDQILFNFHPYLIPVLSVGIPTVLYALAAYFSSNAVYIYRKISNNNYSNVLKN